jgi:hypothetical protein
LFQLVVGIFIQRGKLVDGCGECLDGQLFLEHLLELVITELKDALLVDNSDLEWGLVEESDEGLLCLRMSVVNNEGFLAHLFKQTEDKCEYHQEYDRLLLEYKEEKVLVGAQEQYINRSKDRGHHYAHHSKFHPTGNDK